MNAIQCPSCGHSITVIEKKSVLPVLGGCLLALLAVPIVVAIIGLLAAIAIPSFINARSASEMNACRSNMQEISAVKDQRAGDTTAVAPVCPSGGTYDCHSVGQEVECSVHGTPSNLRRCASQSQTVSE